MITSLEELIAEMNAKPQKITLAWEVLPALDGTLHAVDPDPDPDSYCFAELLEPNLQYSVSLCGKTLQVRDAVVLDNETCAVCLEISGERQREFDAVTA